MKEVTLNSIKALLQQLGSVDQSQLSASCSILIHPTDEEVKNSELCILLLLTTALL